ncbi:MAG: ABC transporter ATP-binding protein, partial [Anaerolineae bacterium]|nr:ABC transporter ATP-binding protein [Anaerolineae bacterium]
HRWWEQTTTAQRRAMYYDFALTIDWMAAELRLYDLKDFFKQSYQTVRGNLRQGLFRLTWRQNLTQIGAGLLALVVTGAVMAVMAWRAMLGLITLGDLVLLYQTFNQGQSLLRSLLGNVGQVYRNSLFLRNLFEFLDLKSYIIDPPNPVPMPKQLQDGIRFRNITFCYPGSDRVALRNFNLDIPAGQTVAIVGANGAGKSTLVKLLCRFYDPEQGTVELDGVDLRHFAQRSLRDQLSVMFQDPVSYHATAAENIAMGQRLLAQDLTRIEQAARQAGAHQTISSLPKGYQTMLNKWFEHGTDLSGGEWQRVALARAFLRQTNIIILDEPTSAMDSWAEAEWLDRFKHLVKGRTAIVITHRFTTAMRADIIHVMDQGQIIESGTHQELLAQGGLYAQSWLAQMQQAGESPGQSYPQPDLSVEKTDASLVT